MPSQEWFARQVCRPLAFHISTLFGILIVITSVSVGWIGFERIVDVIRRHGGDLGRAAAHEIHLEIESIFGPVEAGVALLRHDRVNLATTLQVRLASLTLFREALAGRAPVSAFYVGYGDGDFFMVRRLRSEADRRFFAASAEVEYVVQSIDREPDRTDSRFILFDRDGRIVEDRAMPDYAGQYDPRSRNWYRAAVAGSAMVRTDPYVFRTTGQTGITLAQKSPIAEAVVGADLDLDSLSAAVARRKPTPGSEVALSDVAGRLIAVETSVRPDLGAGSENAPPSLHALQSSPLVALAQSQRADRPPHDADGLTRLEYAERSWLGSVTAVPVRDGTALQLLVAIPEDELLADAYADRNSMIVATALIVALAMLVVSLLSRWISAPLRALTEMADRVSGLDLAHRRLAVSPFVEINSLRDSMEGMRAALGTFMRYVPRDLVRGLIASGQFARVGGRRQPVTLLFTDIEGFTALTETLEPEAVLRATSRYFEDMTHTLMRNHGTIDKFIGDSIMTIWNAPSPHEDHVFHGCLGTLAARAAGDRINKFLRMDGYPEFRTRFGLHTGEALVGNIGASERLQFTALGPTVNLASRIEGLNKIYGTQILVSGAVVAATAGRLAFRQVDLVRAAGTAVPVAIYELLGTLGTEQPFAADAADLAWATGYEAALAAYRSRDFAAAAAGFAALLAARPNDLSAALMAARARAFLVDPPADDWGGIAAYAEK